MGLLRKKFGDQFDFRSGEVDTDRYCEFTGGGGGGTLIFCTRTRVPRVQ